MVGDIHLEVVTLGVVSHRLFTAGLSRRRSIRSQVWSKSKSTTFKEGISSHAAQSSPENSVNNVLRNHTRRRDSGAQTCSLSPAEEGNFSCGKGFGDQVDRESYSGFTSGRP